MRFDVVFTRPSVFADVSFGFCTGKSNSSRVSIDPECLLLGGFDVGKARDSSVDFVMCHFDVGFRHCFTIILRSFVDRFDIGLETNIRRPSNNINMTSTRT